MGSLTLSLMSQTVSTPTTNRLLTQPLPLLLLGRLGTVGVEVCAVAEGDVDADTVQRAGAHRLPCP